MSNSPSVRSQLLCARCSGRPRGEGVEDTERRYRSRSGRNGCDHDGGIASSASVSVLRWGMIKGRWTDVSHSSRGQALLGSAWAYNPPDGFKSDSEAWVEQ